VELRHCEFAGSFSAAVQWPDLDASHQLEATDCLCSASYFISYAQPRQLTLRLERNTFVGDTAILHFYKQLPEPPASPDQRPIRIEARENVLDAKRVLGATRLPPGPFQPEVDKPLLPRSIAWTEHRNLYTGAMLGLGEQVSAKSVLGLETLQEWDEYWGLKDTGSLHGRLVFEGGDVQTRKASMPDKLTAADFRLHADSAGKGLGVDVDQVGPGKAYEARKQTPAYQEWSAATGQLRHPGMFVILPRADQAERKFDSLADAAVAAVSGDTIEIRGNGPFFMPKLNIQGRRALVIRAGAGFEPVLQSDGRAWDRNTYLLASDGPLVLEGLHFRHVDNPARTDGYYTLIRSWEAPLSVTHCRFFLKSNRNSAAINTDRPPRVQVRHCEFAGAFNMAISWGQHTSLHQIEVTDNLCGAPTASSSITMFRRQCPVRSRCGCTGTRSWGPGPSRTITANWLSRRSART
jgi:hypothetical protein